MRWITIAPVDRLRPVVQFPRTLKFARGVTIERTPKHLARLGAVYGLSSIETEQLKRSQFCFVFRQTERDRINYAKAEEIVSVTNLAIWIAKPSSLSFSSVLHVQNSLRAPFHLHVQPVRSLKAHMNDQDTVLSTKDIRLARRLFQAVMMLPRNGTTWRAVYALWLGLRETDWATRILQHWSGLEALFGPEDTQEISYRIALRIAMFLESDRTNAAIVFRKTRNAYNWRSKATHGLKLAKLSEQQSLEVSHHTESCLRSALSKILLSSTLKATIDSKQRDPYLDSLVFSK